MRCRKLRSTFPELGTAAWGVTTVALEDGDTLGLEYLLVPAWFAETFAIDHANAASWLAQKGPPGRGDSLGLAVVALEDSIVALVSANTVAYQAGYDAAYGSYQDQSRRYVAELQKSRFRLGSAVGVLGAAGVGLIIGRAVP